MTNHQMLSTRHTGFHMHVLAPISPPARSLRPCSTATGPSSVTPVGSSDAWRAMCGRGVKAGQTSAWPRSVSEAGERHTCAVKGMSGLVRFAGFLFYKHHVNIPSIKPSLPSPPTFLASPPRRAAPEFGPSMSGKR